MSETLNKISLENTKLQKDKFDLEIKQKESEVEVIEIKNKYV